MTRYCAGRRWHARKDLVLTNVSGRKGVVRVTWKGIGVQALFFLFFWLFSCFVRWVLTVSRKHCIFISLKK